MNAGRRAKLIGVSVIAAAVVLLSLLLIGEPIEEGRCTLTRETTRRGGGYQLGWLASQIIRPLEGRPDNVLDLPVGVENPCYYQIEIGDRQIAVAMNIHGTPRLYVDTDGDGILSKERDFEPERIDGDNGTGTFWRFGPIALTGGDRQEDEAFYVGCYGLDRVGSLLALPASYRTGRLRLAGQTYRVALLDGDRDGRFETTLSPPLKEDVRLRPCDKFAIDRNHDGKFDRPDESMPLGSMIFVDGVYYAIDIAGDNQSLKLSRTEPQFGKLVIEPNDMQVELSLWSDAAVRDLPLGNQWLLPAGNYKAIRLVIEKSDASQQVWRIASRRSSGPSPGPAEFFTIEPGQTTALRIGAPLTVTTEVASSDAGTVDIDLAIRDDNGEKYLPVVQREGRRLPEPALAVVDEEGNVLANGKFEYG